VPPVVASDWWGFGSSIGRALKPGSANTGVNAGLLDLRKQAYGRHHRHKMVDQERSPAMITCIAHEEYLGTDLSRAAECLYDAECALHAARQTHIDEWILAASERLHVAVAAYLATKADDGARVAQPTWTDQPALVA
jgi:hypothetical protein